MFRFWQLNLNHARRAQDLLPHSMLRKEVDIAIIAEPYNGVNEFPRWHKDGSKTAAITWKEEEGKYLKKAGKGN